MGSSGFGGRGRRGFDVNQPHGSLFYSLGDSALDASPYSLSGEPGKPGYNSSRFGGVIGGPLKFPKLFDAGKNTSFFLTVSGTRTTTPYVAFSQVPTVAERAGDFSQSVLTSGAQAGQPVQIFNPVTGQPFAGNAIPQSMISPQAQALLQYIPLPNQPGTQNYRFTDSALNDTTSIGLRLIHNFGAAQQGRRGRGNRSRNNVNFNFNYNSAQAALPQPFPGLGGQTSSRGISLQAGDSVTHGKWTNQLRFNFNQADTNTSNEFAGLTNVAGLAGVTGVSPNPADWGAPTLSFSNFSSLTTVAPLQRRTRVYQVTDTAIRTSGKHAVRVGGDFRRMLLQLHNNPDPNGTFTFTGYATSQLANGQVVPGTGFDLADFLLGVPQQSAIQYSPYTFNFAAIGYDFFVQDTWRVRSNLTIEAGLRYEYVSPYSEADNRLVNLDIAPGFSAVVPVEPGQVGPYSGLTYGPGTVKPDRNNFAPRLGIAWKPKDKIVVRAGYGINYNVGQYQAMVQNLAYQPPFSFTQTNSLTAATPLTLANGFPTSAAAVVTNNDGVNPNYRLGYVQMWNLNLQCELRPTILLNLGYTGSKGTDLDIVEAPNRGPSGLLLSNVQPFLWETSAGDSILHAGSVRLRKRMAHGFSLGGTYTFSKSIDDASSIGGTMVVVAQNPANLAAERGLSSFDVRHRLTADYMYELPFGTGKPWLDKGGAIAHIFGDWTWSGNFTIQSGTPFTATVLGNYTEVEQGVNGSLRANYNGQPIAIGNPSVQQWFNTAAFSVPPPGQFGSAGRNTIIGPGQVNFDMAITKTFPLKEMKSLEVRLAATNVFNTPHFTAINTVVNSPLFGQVTSAGSMRQLQILARFRF